MPVPEPKNPDTPAGVIATVESRAPVDDPALGIEVAVDRTATPTHRLVTIGDSVTHGFQSGAIYNTDLSYPAIVAAELGYDRGFSFPTYPGFGGLPLNIELVVRDLAMELGRKISFWELAPAVFRLRGLMDRIEDWWERGAGAEPPLLAGIHGNLAVYGWDLRDALDRTGDICRAEIARPTDAFFRQVVENANERAALRVLPTEGSQSRTVFDCARELGEQGGIETLVVMLGANNALRTVTELCVVWSEDGYDSLDGKRNFTVWNPKHFEHELGLVVDRIEAIDARHVIMATVPHVTIAPIARGVDRKVRPGSRYFPHYTRPWIRDADFEPSRDPAITESQARDVDHAIDQYNDAIVAAVRAAREQAATGTCSSSPASSTASRTVVT
jgi:hypothetical protein